MTAFSAQTETTDFHRFSCGLDTMFEMSNVTKHLLCRFLHENSGKLSKRSKSKEFSKLEEHEVDVIEELFRECFE